MATKKTRTLIVYEDSQKDLETVALALKSSLVEAGCTVKLRAASEVSIPEVLGAQVYFFGVNSRDMPSWAELNRLFKGINLAGRHVSFFSKNGSDAPALLAMALADTEISCNPEILSGAADAAAIKIWANNAQSR